MKRILMILCAGMVILSASGKKPLTLFLIGDETMCEQTSPEDRTDSSAVGWGQVLGQYLPEGTIIENHAFEGATTRSLKDDGRWTNILARANRGTMLFIQLGQKDYDESDGRTYSSLEDFENHLMAMIEEAQKKHLKVVLLTPVAKRHFKEGVLHPRHGAYAEGVRRVATRLKLPLIDVDAMTYTWLESLGEEKAKLYFAGEDEVRLNENGAKIVAEKVVEAAREKKVIK